MQKFSYTNQRELRAAFWATQPNGKPKKYSSGDYPADTRVAWCEFVDNLHRDGQISEALAFRATLEG